MSAVASSPIRATESLTIREWIAAQPQDPLGVTALFLLDNKQEFIHHALLELQKSAIKKDINFHVIREEGDSSYHITPTHIWRKIKGSEKFGVYKKKKLAVTSNTQVARLVTHKFNEIACPIAEYNIQKLFVGMRGIVTVYDFIKSTNRYGKPIYTTYAENYNLGDLETCFKAKISFSAEDRSQITEDLIIGLRQLHTGGYIHADIKRKNVVLSRNAEGKIKAALCDFGFAKKISLSQGPKSGSPCHTPPEKWTTKPWSSSLDLNADVWSLGIVFFMLYTNKLPGWFKGTTKNEHIQLLLQMAKEGDSFITDEQAASKPEINLIQKMCQYNPNNRPTIEQVYQEYKNCVS